MKKLIILLVIVAVILTACLADNGTIQQLSGMTLGEVLSTLDIQSPLPTPYPTLLPAPPRPGPPVQ